MKTVAIYIFDDVEVLDFAGPFEVFNVAGETTDPRPFTVYTVAKTEAPVKARGGLTIVPHYSFETLPQIDILLVPGGWGTRALLKQVDIVEWVRQQSENVERLLSVCTGSLVLGKAGLLDGLDITTHYGALDSLREIVPSANVLEDTRYIDNGKIVTSAGISAGIDMALHIVQQMAGETALANTLKEMEYDWQPLE